MNNSLVDLSFTQIVHIFSLQQLHDIWDLNSNFTNSILVDFITVTSFPYEFQVYNRQTIALETNRQSIILSCTYNNTEWLQPPVSSNTLLPDGRILINELTNNSEGEYTCSNATGIEYTTITILQGSQQIQISVDGVIFDDSLLTIYPCAHPKLITCSITDNIHDTHLLLYSAYSRGVISHNVSSAVLDTSVLRATDSGVYICGTDVLGYAVSVEIQLDILQANYILLEYGTKSLPLVNGQTVNLDPLTSAIVLSCQGTLPHWQSYPTSNTTQLVNDSTSLYLDLSNSQADGEYLCIDNSTGEITLISITTDYTVGMEVTESELQITEYIQIENLDTSVYVQSGDYPIIPYGTLGIKLSCSLQGLISWRYQQGSDGVCLIPGGILIRTIDSYTRGEYSCSNGDNTISISLNNIIQLTQLYTSQISAGYNSISIPVFSRNITLSCDSSDPAWLLNFTLNNSTIRIDSSDYQCNINGMLIRVYDGVIYFDSFGLFESGYYTCDPETSRQTTVYLQSSVRIDVTQDGVIQTFIGNDNITIHVSATGILISCITGSDNAELRSFGVPSNGLNILNDSSTVINYFWNRSPYQFSCSDSVYPLSSNATVNIITEGLELFANFSTSPIKISTNSILLQSPATTLSLTCLYGSINTPPILTYRNLSNYVTPFSANVQTQINLNGLEINITASYINFTTAIAKNSIAINGNYACVGSQNELINFTVYHVQSVTPRIVFYRNFSLTSLRVISSPLSGINDILECRAEILETTILVEKVEWLLNGVPFLDDVGSLLNLSSLQPQTAEYECRAYSRFFNVSRIIRVTIQGVPTAPINLSVSEITTSSAVLSWKFASISQNTGITAYQIEYTTIQNPSNTIYATSTSMSVLLQTLKPFTQYSVRVRARNFYGYGDYSDNVIFHTQHAGQIISNLTNTSVIISLITPIPSDAIIQSYRITISGAKLYDLDYTETRNAILVNSSVTQLKLDELTPDTLYTLIIVSLDSMGVFLTTTSVSVHTEPGVLNVTNPVIWSTPLRGLQSILLNLEGTSNRNAEILYHLLFMVEVPVSFDTDLFDIIAFLTNGKSRNSRDTSALKSVIQLSIVANISTQTCDSFPNFLLIGDNRGITPCDFSQLQNLTNYTDKIQTDFSPELEFNYKYAFVLTASTRNEIIYYSPVSEFISLLPEETDGFDFGIIYTIVAVGIVFILFLLSVLLIYCLIRFGRKLFKKRRSPPKQEESQMLAAIDLSLTTSKGSIAFVNPLFKTLEEPNRIPISLAPFEDLAKNTFCIKSEFVIHIDEFGEHVRELHDNFNQGFTQEYNRLYERRQSDAIVAQKPCNRHLNRFVDIFPYDDSRVVLTPISESDHDYINASFLNGYDRERNYIATQAPFMDMIVDFWRQCWEYNIAVIALLTDSIEGRKTRNYYYWPEDLTTEISFGPFVIKLTDILIKPSFIRRALLLKNILFPNETRRINQFHYISWPDTSMPEISSFLNFHTIVSSFYKSQKQSGPLLVHCRSGAGASAVFIFLDILRTQAHAENQIDIHRCITTMRSMRSRMVCSMEYYIYAHDLLLASLICGNTCIDAPSYPHRIKKLSEVDSRTHATGYNTEYITLDQISNSPQDYPHTLAQENPTMNRKIEFLPIDSRCVSLSHGEYINATFVNGYERENAFIIAESPLINTVGRFWQLIFEHRCRAVITLCDLTQDQQEVGAKYWMESGEPVTYRDLTVQLSNIIHPEHGAYTIHTFMLTSARIKGGFEVKQFIYHEFDENFLPANSNNFVKLITQVIDLYSDEKTDPILVHCGDTVGCSGMFCASLYSIERLLAENEVDVFGCVRQLRKDKPGIIPTLTHYKGIYKTILSFIIIN